MTNLDEIFTGNSTHAEKFTEELTVVILTWWDRHQILTQCFILSNKILLIIVTDEPVSSKMITSRSAIFIPVKGSNGLFCCTLAIMWVSLFGERYTSVWVNALDEDVSYPCKSSSPVWVTHLKRSSIGF